MKIKAMVTLMVGLASFTFAQETKPVQKVDYNQRMEQRIEKFAEAHQLSKEKKEELKKAVELNREEMKQQRQEEMERREQLKSTHDERLKNVLGSDELLEEWNQRPERIKHQVPIDKKEIQSLDRRKHVPVEREIKPVE